MLGGLNGGHVFFYPVTVSGLAGRSNALAADPDSKEPVNIGQLYGPTARAYSILPLAVQWDLPVGVKV